MINSDDICNKYKNNFEVFNLDRYGKLNKKGNFYFYYDESDHISNYTLKKGSYNDSYFSQFTFGGLMSNDEINNEDFDDLFESLNLLKILKN